MLTHRLLSEADSQKNKWPRPENTSAAERRVAAAPAGCGMQRGRPTVSLMLLFLKFLFPVLGIGDYVKFWAGRNSCYHVLGAGSTRLTTKTQGLQEAGRKLCVVTRPPTGAVRHLTFFWNSNRQWLKKKRLRLLRKWRMLLHNQRCVTKHRPGELQIDPEDRAQIKHAHPSVFALLFILYFPPIVHLLQVPL